MCRPFFCFQAFAFFMVGDRSARDPRWRPPDPRPTEQHAGARHLRSAPMDHVAAAPVRRVRRRFCLPWRSARYVAPAAAHQHGPDPRYRARFAVAGVPGRSAGAPRYRAAAADGRRGVRDRSADAALRSRGLVYPMGANVRLHDLATFARFLHATLVAGRSCGLASARALAREQRRPAVDPACLVADFAACDLPRARAWVPVVVVLAPAWSIARAAADPVAVVVAAAVGLVFAAMAAPAAAPARHAADCRRGGPARPPRAA